MHQSNFMLISKPALETVDSVGKGSRTRMAKKGTPSLSTRFLAAAKRGEFEAVLSLFSEGASLSSLDAQGNTALHLAAKEGLGLTVSTLIGLGADVNARNMQKETPLMLLAAKKDGAAIAEEILRHGGNIHLTNAFGKTALHLAQDAKNDKVSSLLKRAHYDDAQNNPRPIDVALKHPIRIGKPLTFIRKR